VSLIRDLRKVGMGATAELVVGMMADVRNIEMSFSQSAVMQARLAAGDDISMENIVPFKRRG
jgi:hypothetical protein